MGTNCALLLVVHLLYSYEAEFIQKLVKDKRITDVEALSLALRYIDIINFPHLDSNIPNTPASDVYNSQFVRYAIELAVCIQTFATSPSSEY